MIMKNSLALVQLQREDFKIKWEIIFADAEWEELQNNMEQIAKSPDKVYQFIKQTNTLTAFVKWMLETKGTFLLPKL